MFRKRWFQTLTKFQISRMRGGEKHDFKYFVALLENAESDILTDVMYVKLLNQMGSQTSRRFPDGYEPFQTGYGTAKFCLRTMTISVPRLRFRSVGWPNPKLTPQIEIERRPVCILNPASGTEAFKALRWEAETFQVKHRIRRYAIGSSSKLDLVLRLMAYREDAIPFCDDLADRFEAYLSLRSSEFLRQLLVLLDMPEPSPKPTEPKLILVA